MRKVISIFFALLAVSVLGGCFSPVELVTDLPGAKADAPYKTQIKVTGGSGNYNFALVSGFLPSGLILDQNGIISGTLTAEAGLYSFTVRAEDAIFGENEYFATTDEEEMTIHVDDTPYKWTILIHFAVDNNITYEFEDLLGLVSYYLETLEAVEAADLDNSLQILVLMDSYNPDTVYADGYYRITGGDFQDDLVIDLAEINSGDLGQIKDFLDWAFAQYPSEHYLYSVFNHGSGFNDADTSGAGYAVKGIAFDDSHDDCLTHHELGLANAYLAGLIGHNVDLFYAFACLMGGVELAYELKDCSDYLLLSEEAFPADLWSYEALETIVDDPGVGAEELGRAFCDSAYDYFERIILSREFTLALIDVANMDAVYQAIDEYALAALADINDEASIAAYYNQAADESFTMCANIEDIEDYYYVDLGDYLDHIKASPGIGPAVKIKADIVKAALAQSVVYLSQYGYSTASGLSIFHNIWNSEFQYPPTIYKQILDFGSNSWSDYMQLMDSLQP